MVTVQILTEQFLINVRFCSALAMNFQHHLFRWSFIALGLRVPIAYLFLLVPVLLRVISYGTLHGVQYSITKARITVLYFSLPIGTSCKYCTVYDYQRLGYRYALS